MIVRVRWILLDEGGVVRSSLVVALKLEVVNVRELEPRVGRFVTGGPLVEVSFVFFGRELVVPRVPRLGRARQRLLRVPMASADERDRSLRRIIGE